MKRHWLTTIFGFLLALGTATTNAPGMRDKPLIRDIGGVIASVAALALGMAAADKDKVLDKEKETKTK